MFGTIKPKTSACTKCQRKEYKKYYCGLCCSMDKCFGNFSRFFINYDLTNEIILTLSCVENLEEKTAKCPWSWKRKKVTYIDHPVLLEYFAKLNYLMIYYKLLDDLNDENSLKSKIILKKMKKNISLIQDEFETEITIFNSYLQKLHDIERANEHIPVFLVAELFGVLMEQIINPTGLNNFDGEVFSKINYWIGIWIYTMDAILDCLKDAKNKNYNPILAGLEGDSLFILRERKIELIDILVKCRTNISNLLELYPVYRNKELLKNLFEGDLPKIVYMYLEVESDEFDCKRNAKVAENCQ